MTLIELMKRDGLRVTNGDRWLIVDGFGKFMVFCKPYRKPVTTTITETHNEAEAVAELEKGNPW